jgi:AcrR family transcriptional regulator
MQKRNAARTRHKILQAARRLFAESGIEAVGIRDIAGAAGVSHGLVQRYCGTRAQLVAGIVQEEVERFVAGSESAPAPVRPPCTHEDFRGMLKTGGREFEDFARVIVHAELAGLAPGEMLATGQPTPATQTIDLIRKLRRRASSVPPPLDPVLVSAYVNASLFAFATMAPWLMAAVGLRPEDYESRADEIHEISVRLIALAAGVSADEQVASPVKASRPAKRRRPTRVAKKQTRR